MIVDGYDVVFNKLDDIVEKFKKYDTRILYNASKNNYPNVYIDKIPERDYLGSFRFFNAGCCIGYTQDLIKFYEECLEMQQSREIMSANLEMSEQFILRHVFKKYSETAFKDDNKEKYVKFDNECSIFICMGNGDFEWNEQHQRFKVY